MVKRNAEFYARLLGGLGAAYAAWTISHAYASVPPTGDQLTTIGMLMLVSIGIGLVITPYLVVHPIRTLLHHARHMPSLDLAAIGFGTFLGLVAGALLTFPLSHLPQLLGQYLPFGGAMLCAYVGAVVANWRKQDLLALFNTTVMPSEARRYLLDTSVIVDGRIAELIQTGVIDGTLVVPQCVLREVQLLADSADDLTRAKGKRGLDVLHTLQHDRALPVTIMDDHTSPTDEVDEALIALAKAERLHLITNDANLQRVAELRRVRTINLHQIADALRQPFMPGDTLRITIRQEGREREQGVGFLHDGTMIVVEDARHLLGKEIGVAVTRIYQTATGRIVFAQRI